MNTYLYILGKHLWTETANDKDYLGIRIDVVVQSSSHVPL